MRDIRAGAAIPSAKVNQPTNPWPRTDWPLGRFFWQGEIGEGRCFNRDEIRAGDRRMGKLCPLGGNPLREEGEGVTDPRPGGRKSEGKWGLPRAPPPRFPPPVKRGGTERGVEKNGPPDGGGRSLGGELKFQRFPPQGPGAEHPSKPFLPEIPPPNLSLGGVSEAKKNHHSRLSNQRGPIRQGRHEPGGRGYSGRAGRGTPWAGFATFCELKAAPVCGPK